MLITRLSLYLVLAAVVSALPTYHLPFSGHPIPSTPHLIYGSPQGNLDFRGFSYFTDDFSGGRSEVVFVTGPDAENQMNNEVQEMHDLKVATFSDKASNSGASSTAAPTEIPASPEVPSEPKEEPSTSSPDLVSTAAPPQSNDDLSTRVAEQKPEEVPQENQDGVSQDGGENTFPPQQPSPLAPAPYPILRLGGSGSFYPQFSAGFSGYLGPSSVIRSHYDPYYGQYDPYGSSYEPYVNSYNPFVNSYNPFYGTRSGYYNQYQSPLFTAALDNYVGREEPLKTISSYDIFNSVRTRVGAEEQPQSAPEQAAVTPKEITPAPEQMTSAPKKEASESEQVTPASDQITAAPERKVPEPEPMTPAPEQMTPVPEQMTPAPEKLSPAPKQADPAPEQPATTTEQSSTEDEIADLVPKVESK